MLSFSGQDILTPGFRQSGLVIEDTNLKPQESISGNLHLERINGPVALLLSSVNNPITFDIQIMMSDGELLHKEYKDGLIGFVPTSSGDYTISVKNLSLKSTVLRISYGSYVNQDYSSIFSIAIWLGLIISGNYLIVHSRFMNVHRSFF